MVSLQFPIHSITQIAKKSNPPVTSFPLRRPIYGPSSVVFADAVLDGEESVEEEAEREKLRPEERDGDEPRHPAAIEREGGPSRKWRGRGKFKFSFSGAE